LHVARQYSTQRRVRKIVCGINDYEEEVCNKRVQHLSTFIEIRSAERKQGNRAERNCCPQHPGTKFPPACVGPVSDRTHYKVEERANESADQHNETRLCRRYLIDVGVEERQECHQRLEDQVCSKVAQAVANLF